MTFLQPMMLWSFLAIIPLTAFYFLKVRPRRKPTTAFFLWEKVFEEKRSSSLFQRFRDVWSLLLMLLAFSAVCLALARPQWTDRRRDVLILVDNSASMSAREGSSSRLEEAKRTAAEIVEGLNGSQRAAVATIGHVLAYKSHLTDNPRELIDAVESIEPSNRRLRLDALPRREDEQNRWDREHRVLLISDGGFDTASLPEHVELLKIGESQENVGLVAADMSYLPGGANQLGFYFQVASSFEKPCDVDLSLVRVDDYGKEQLFKVIPLQVKPGVNPPETFTLEDASPGRWVARLGLDDALSADNTANLAAIKPDPIRVAVDSSDKFFLENSIIAFERGDKLLTLVDEQPAMVLAKSKTPTADVALIFRPAGESCWWSDLGDEVEVGVPRVVVADHPALRHLDVASMAFVGARRLTPPPGAQVLVADERGLPLIYKARHKLQTAIVVNLDPSAAEFYFSAWFPVMVHSSATHLVGRENTLRACYRPGDSVPVPGVDEDGHSKLVTIDQADSTDDSDNDMATEITGKWCTLGDRLGHYELKNDAGSWLLGNSLLCEQETMLDNDSIAGTDQPISRGRSPAYLLTLLAIVVLSGESILYHRRKVG